jgi:hypothetical protein
MPTAIPSEPLTNKIRDARGENVGLDFTAVVVGAEVYGFFVEIF